MKILRILSVLMLLLSTTLSAEIFTAADWDRVDTVLILMKRNRYQHDVIIVKKAHRRLTLTSVETENKFVWMFDANVKKAFLGNSEDGLYWIMINVNNITQKTSDSTELIRAQLTIIETIVALVNAKENLQ